jgi:hypothetical protein
MVVEFYLVFVVIPLYPLCNFLNYEDLTTKIENKIKKNVEGMYKRNVITKEIKGYLIPKGSQPGKVQANIEFPGNGCGILFNFCSNSVVSFMLLFKLHTFSISSCSTTSAIFSVA